MVQALLNLLLQGQFKIKSRLNKNELALIQIDVLNLAGAVVVDYKGVTRTILWGVMLLVTSVFVKDN